MDNLKTAYIVVYGETVICVCDNETDTGEMCLSLLEEEMYLSWLEATHALFSDEYISPANYKAMYPHREWWDNVAIIQAPLLFKGE